MQSPFGEHGGLGAATYDYSSFMTGADGAQALGVAPGSSAGTRAAAPGRRFDGGEITPPSGSVAAMPHLSYDKGEEWGSGDASLSHTPLSGATDTPESGSGSPPSSGAVTKATIAKAKASGCNLICNYLPASLTESELRQMMLTCGAVLRCKIVLNKRTRHSAGYGFVLFSDYESATNAIQKFDGMPLRGKRLKVARARPQDPQRQRANLFVAGIHPILDNTDLHALFASFGDIIECKVLFDKTTRRSRSVGFVRYHFRADACAAIENLSGRETRLPAAILSRHLNPTGGYLLPETILLQIKFADGSSYPKRGNGGTSSSSTGSSSPSPRGRDPVAYAPQTYGAPVMAPQAPAYGGMPPGGFYSMGPMAPPVPAAGRGGPAGAPGGEAVPTWGDHGLPMQGFSSRGMHYTMPVAMGPGGQMAPYAVPYSNSGSMAFASQMAALNIHDSRSAGHPAAPMYAPQGYAMAPAADAAAAPSHMRAAASGPASLPAQPLFVGATAGPTTSATAAAAESTPAAATSTVATSSAAADGAAASAAPTTAATEPASSAGGEEAGADPFGASLGFSGLGPNLIPTLPSIPQLAGGQPQPSSLYYFPSDAGSTPGLTGYPMAYGSMPAAGYTSGMAPMASAADLALDAEESSGSTRLSKWASAATE